MIAIRALAVLVVLGFVLPCGRASEVRYTVRKLVSGDSNIEFSDGMGINRWGDVAGYLWTVDPLEAHAFVYTDTKGFRDLGQPGGGLAFGMAINDVGQIAMRASPVAGVSHVFRFTEGVGFEDLGGLEGSDYSEVGGINNLGQITGYSELATGEEPGFRYTDGIGFERLEGLWGQGSRGWDINDASWVAGETAGHAFLYRADIGMLDLGIGGAYAINNQGSVAGTAGRHVGALEAFIYRDGQVHLLGKLEKGLNSDALGINNHDVVVGQSDLDPWQTTRYTPFIWNAVEGIVDLNSLIPPDSGWSLSRTSDINDFGQITGYGYNEGKGEAFRLDPIPPRLSIECHSTHIIVFWHPNWPGLVLETTHNLVAPNWHPLDTGGTNVVTISTTTVMRFFRLNLDGIRGLCCSPQ